MRYNAGMDVDPDRCYRAMEARDARFDGIFYVAVSTTGIYCRPVCTARTPRRDRCSFYTTAAEAEKAGYRACLRCRPELAPGAGGTGTVDALPRLVADAARLIEAGYLDEHSVDELAAHLGVTARHLRRATEHELGVSPVELAQTRRMAMAKRLLHDTTLGLTQIALTSGFGSVRRFNAAFAERFGRPPSALRRRLPTGAAPLLALRLDTRPPFDWDLLTAFLAARAIPGVEELVATGTASSTATASATSVASVEYRRVVSLDGAAGVVRVRRDPERCALWAEISPGLAGRAAAIVPLLRRLFDLDARPAQIQEHLAKDALLAPLIKRRPGLRVPGAVDPFEIVCRAVLGQQVSVRAASTLAGRFSLRFGEALPAAERDGLPEGSTLSLRFPAPAVVAAASAAMIAELGMPLTRAQTLHHVARAFSDGALARAVPSAGTLTGALDPAAFAAALLELPGIGDWTAQYVAMRALGAPDAFPASDLGIRKALGGLGPKPAIERAEAWRPWRSYAVMHLWFSLSDEQARPVAKPTSAVKPEPAAAKPKTARSSAKPRASRTPRTRRSRAPR